jgi:hemerythrin-like domain-containing protein
VGLIDPSETDKPHLMDKAVVLQREHESIRRMLIDLSSAAHELSPSEEQYFYAYCRNALSFLDQLDQHERSEMLVLQQLYNDDTGGEG